jgi:hypothetical protein
MRIILSTRRIALLSLTLVSLVAHAQPSYEFGILPSINFNKTLPHNFKLNFKLESRQSIRSGIGTASDIKGYDYILTDLTSIAAKQIAYNKTLSLGYLFRLRDEQIVHRSIQQFIVTQSFTGFKFSQRFATDQTFSPTEDFEFRLRYRLAAAIPFNGLSVDPKELYFKISNEYLNSLKSGMYDLEIRLLPFVGYKVSELSELEMGIDYRINQFLQSPAQNRIWLGMNWYWAI